MKIINKIFIFALIAVSCKGKPVADKKSAISDTLKFPAELTEFTAWGKNPVFTGTGTDTWDQKIRERGYILHEDGTYYMWYTGYKGDESVEKHLGLATSTDGLVMDKV